MSSIVSLQLNVPVQRSAANDQLFWNPNTKVNVNLTMIQKKVTKNLDPNKANGHDMIDIRKYLQNLFSILSHKQQFYFWPEKNIFSLFKKSRQEENKFYKMAKRHHYCPFAEFFLHDYCLIKMFQFFMIQNYFHQINRVNKTISLYLSLMNYINHSMKVMKEDEYFSIYFLSKYGTLVSSLN